MDKSRSFADALINNPDYLDSYKRWSPQAALISTFIFHHSELAAGVVCWECKRAEADPDARYNVVVNDIEYDSGINLLWCLGCDRTFHICCSGELNVNLTDAKAPWICLQCRTNPENQFALELKAQKKHNLTFAQRLSAIKLQTGEASSDEEDSHYQSSFHVDANLNVIAKEYKEKFEKQKNESIKLGEMFRDSYEKNKQLEEELDRAKRESEANRNMVDELLKQLASKQKTTTNSNTCNNHNNEPKQFQTHAPPSSTTYNDNEAKNQKKNKSFVEKVLTAEDIIKNLQQPQPKCTNLNGCPSPVFPRTFTDDVDAHIMTSSEKFARDQSLYFSLTEIRKNLPKIESFDGNPSKWLTFERAVARNRREGQYSQELSKYHIRNALTGIALQRVENLFDTCTADEIMAFLKEAFGNTTVVVESARRKVLAIKLPKQLTHANVIEATTIIATYLNACKYANIYFHDVALSMHIHNQLESYYQQMYYSFFMRKHPDETRVERLDVQFEFLEDLAKTLPIGTFNSNHDEKEGKGKKGNNFQLMSIASSSSKPQYKGNKTNSNNKNDFKFEIRSKETAPYIGYDLEKVKTFPKRCVICEKSGHYAAECRTLKAMSMDERHNAVKSKQLCANCLLTTDHQSKDCDVKLGCGFNTDSNSKCSLKHHIALHRGKSNKFRPNAYKKQQNRARSNQNLARAEGIISQQQQSNSSTNAANSQQSSTVIDNSSASSQSKYQGPVACASMSIATLDENGYQVFTMNKNDAQSTSGSSPRTIKLFRTFVFGPKAKAIAYAVGDSAAEVSIIKRSLADALGLRGTPCSVDVQWTDRQIKSMPAHRINIKIKGILPDSKDYLLQDVYAVDDFNLPPRSLDVDQLKLKFPYLRPIPFASYKNAIPAILIGTKDAHLIEAIEPIKQDGDAKPVGIKTKIGYSIYGGASEEYKQIHSTCTISSTDSTENENEIESITNSQLSEQYAYSCSLESLGIKPITKQLTREEQSAIDLVEEEMKVLPNGSIELPLIWNRVNGKIPSLPNNFNMVMKRQIAQENKLKKDPNLLHAFNENFKALIDQEYVRAATTKDLETKWPNVMYIPMSLVINQNKVPIKTRNVYDASAKFQGTSLNDNLLMGPNLLIDMLKPLMRIRMNKVAYTADVKQMFHRIKICERDQQCQRILWRQNLEEPMQTFIQTVMLFGPKCSPFCSQIVKNKTADKFRNQYPKAADILQQYVYMDDLLDSEPTTEEAVETAKQCIEILASINWELIGFQSNCKQFLSSLPKSHIKNELIPLMTMEEESYTTKVLGIAWNPTKDAFVFDLNKNVFVKLASDYGHRPTKRDQCSTVSRIFDMLGFIAHCTIRGRILLQRAWRQKIDWDEEISENDDKEWKKWIADLKQIEHLCIPRKRFNLNALSEADAIELHTFADAGKEAIAAVSYMVAVMGNTRSVSFVMAKAKVAPIKLTSHTEITQMPRLEMLACTIASRMATNIINLHPAIQFKSFLWTDSEIVLRWLLNENLKLPKFAIAPIDEILELTKREQWRYVDSKSNVADKATKFQRIDFSDFNSEWYQGPPFLKLSRNQWPSQKFQSEQSQMLALMQSDEVIKLPKQLPPIDCKLASRYIIDILSPSITGNWIKLVRAIARGLKLYFDALIPLLKSKQWRHQSTRQLIKERANLNFLTPVDIERAQLFIVRSMQIEAYPNEFAALQKGKRVSNKELLQLNVFMDEDNVMRIHSRVNLPHSEYPQKFNPLVPRKSTLSEVMLFHYHKKFRHVCLESQMAEFRAHFWMPALREGLKKVVERCNHCHLMRTRPYIPKMAPLPTFRVDAKLKPFEVTGLDCAGPFIVYNHTRPRKVWLLIFTCTVTRFIHLHILDSMDTTHTIEAITYVYTAHGPIAKLISDNGKNFEGASNIFNREKLELIKQLKAMKAEVDAKFAQEKLLSWYFIPVQSPWFGAFYERLIKEVKRAIHEEIKQRKIQRIAFSIAVQEAAHRINCRPLTYNSISHEDEEVLTPHHLCKYRSGWPLLPSVHSVKKPHSTDDDHNHYRRGLKTADGILQRFTKNYLTELTKRTKWYKDSTPLAVNDLVLLIDPTQTRKQWERARVLKLYKSRDGRKRVADILMADGTLKKNRSVQRLAKIEISTRN